MLYSKNLVICGVPTFGLKTNLANVAIIVLLVCLHTKLLKAEKSTKELCPIGFLVGNNSDGKPVCYQIKGPETFADKYENCAGNLYSLKLLQSLKITPTSQTLLWTDDGPFVDWAYTMNTVPLQTPYDVYSGSNYIDEKEELCVAIDSRLHFEAVRCVEEHYRYCIVDTYEDLDKLSSNDCDSLQNPDFDGFESMKSSKSSHRFWSPIPVCLLKVVPQRGEERMTWNQAQQACKIRGGSLLNRGWRYSNHPFQNNKTGNLTHPVYPFGVIVDENLTMLRYDADNDNAFIPQSEWHFGKPISKDMRLGAVRDDSWELVNSSYIFKDVICEKNIPLRHVNLSVSIDINDEDNIILNVDTKDLKKENIICFTDSNSFYAQPVNIIERIDKPGYILVFSKNGYYWCTHNDLKQFHLSESNKVLRIIKNYDIETLYAVKLKSLTNSYDISKGMDQVVDYWNQIIEEYIIHNIRDWTRRNFDDDEGNQQTFMDRQGPVQVVLKRLYLDWHSALLHVEVETGIVRLPPGRWKDIEIIYIRPAYFCEEQYPLTTRLVLGETKRTSDCQIFSCVGNFNEGVQLNITTENNCNTTLVSVGNEKYENDDDHVDNIEYLESTMKTKLMDIKSTAPPPHKTVSEEQLLQVMDDLNTLLNENTEEILVADIEDSFDQVDGFLCENEDLEIPEDLLHILDKLGARIDLNGTVDTATVRDNVALLVADAQPNAPVRGLMIATRNGSTFTKEAFQFIRGDMDSDHLMADANEVVIHLPESVANSNRRISFVVFRNDRAFQSSHGLYSVNSRILSVNVENTTEFVDEYIDIFFTPINKDPGRNESRSCAFWKFLNGTESGYWSQDGCTFIRATTDGMLDTCRCDHLTHFAEVLIPRTVFSERDENALKLISIVGCFMSILGLIVVGVTALLFTSWRRNYSNKIWLQLCISIFIMSLSFLVILFAHFEEYDILCMLTGIFLHFSVLSSVCWMLIAAVLSYRKLVTVFSIEASHKLLRASAFAWGVPCAVVGILLSVAPLSYSGRFDDKNPTTAFCYPSGLARWLSVFAPIALMLIANWTLFALIVRSVFASRKNRPNRTMNRRSSDKQEALRCASVSFFLVFLFGLPWIFGLLAMNVVMAYFFVILSTFQGFILFVLFVLGNKNTRDLWLNIFKIRQNRKIPLSTLTYTNDRSTGTINANSHKSSDQERMIETKLLTPKSLSSSDDSRFS